MPGICTIADCGKVSVGRGWCRFHYTRWQQQGDPLGVPIKTPNGGATRFVLANVDYDLDDCLLWPFPLRKNSYPRATYQGKKWIAARLMCFLVHGAPPTKAHETAHSCGKGHHGCISPRHVRWKTPSENQSERTDHGTSNRGSRHGNSKLTESDIGEIVALIGKKSQQQIADRFGVAQTAISEINLGKTWGWLTGRSQCR